MSLESGKCLWGWEWASEMHAFYSVWVWFWKPPSFFQVHYSCLYTWLPRSPVKWYTLLSLWSMAWKGGNGCEVERCVAGAWRLGFRSSLLLTGSVTLNKALRHIHKDGVKVQAYRAGCESPMSPKSPWIIVTAQWMLVEALSESIFPALFGRLSKEEGFMWCSGAHFIALAPCSSVCRNSEEFDIGSKYLLCVWLLCCVNSSRPDWRMWGLAPTLHLTGNY